jgi:3-oxoadipate enol-lactonase
MAYVTLPDGTDIFYQRDNFSDPWRSDNATPVIFLHGFCRNSSFWYAWVPTLARHFDTLRWDARGVGRSTKPPAEFPWTLERLCQDVIEFMDALAINQAYFIGESLGGMIMPSVALRFPDRVKGFVACSSNLAITGQIASELAPNARDMPTAIREAASISDYIRATEDGRLSPRETTAEMRDWYCKAWAETPRRTWEEWSSVLVPQVHNTPAMLQKIAVPVLYICAQRSTRSTEHEARVWTDNIPKARLALIDSESQGIAHAKPDECAAIACEFLRSLP